MTMFKQIGGFLVFSLLLGMSNCPFFFLVVVVVVVVVCVCVFF